METHHQVPAGGKLRVGCAGAVMKSESCFIFIIFSSSGACWEPESRFSLSICFDLSSVSYWDSHKSKVWAKHSKLPSTLQVTLESVSPLGAGDLRSPRDGNPWVKPALHFQVIRPPASGSQQRKGSQSRSFSGCSRRLLSLSEAGLGWVPGMPI